MGLFDKNLVGLDIGGHTDKVVSLSGGPGSYTLNGAACVRRAMPGASAPTPDATIDGPLVSGMLSAMRLKSRRTSAALSMDHVTFRQFELPVMPEPDLQKAVRWQLKKESALPGADAVTDFLAVSPPTSSEGREKVQLIAFAVARSDIDPLIRSTAAASMDLRHIEVAPTALLAAFDMAYEWEEGANYAVLDMGSAMSTLAILKDKRLVFIRRISFGGAPVVSSVAASLGMDMEAAERYVSEKGLIDSDTAAGTAHAAVAEQIDRLSSELRRSIDYYHAQFRAGAVSSVLLAGGPALIPGISDYMTASLGIDTFLMDPFRRVKTGKGVDGDSIASIAPSVAVAAGLATRRC